MGPPSELTKLLATLALKPSASIYLDELPEEILNTILEYLCPQVVRMRSALKDLASVSLVSHKLHRIAEPHLYKSVLVVFNRAVRTVQVRTQQGRTINGITCFTCNQTTTLDSNAAEFLRTLKARPDVAKHVKKLWLVRGDYGFRIRNILDACSSRSEMANWPFEMSASELLFQLHFPKMYYPVELGEQGAPSFAQPHDTASPAHHELLRLLPNVVQLDRVAYVTDTAWDPLLNPLEPSIQISPRPDILSKLTTIRINGNGRGLARVWPLFTRPGLRDLVLKGFYIEPASAEQTYNWEKLSKVPIQILCIMQCNLRCGLYDHRSPLALVANACEVGKLEILSLLCHKTSDAHVTMQHTKPFKEHFDTLQAAAIFEPLPRTSTPYARMALNAHYISEELDQRNLKLRFAKHLRILTVDVIDLYTAISEEALLELGEHAGMVGNYCLTDSLVPGRKFRFYVDLHLPRSLETLVLKIGPDIDQHRGLVGALGHLVSSNVRKFFPALQEIRLLWYKCDDYPDIGEEIPTQLQKHGISFVQEFLDPLHPQYVGSQQEGFF